MNSIIRCYYPVLFLIVFAVILALIIKTSINEYLREKKRKKNANSINNIDKLMNNEQHTTNEIELVDALRDKNIIYRGTE